MKTERDYLIDAAQRNAREAMIQARSTLERSLRELDRYAKRFERAESLYDKADVMNGLLNELASNIMPNLRLDLIASAQAELVRVHEVASADNQE
jgi:hypothetical protein